MLLKRGWNSAQNSGEATDVEPVAKTTDVSGVVAGDACSGSGDPWRDALGSSDRSKEHDDVEISALLSSPPLSELSAERRGRSIVFSSRLQSWNSIRTPFLAF
jgi:hypothetical protein